MGSLREGATGGMEDEQRSLGEGEEFYRLLVESAKDYAIFAVDTDGRIADWNLGAERVFGYRQEEIVGRPVSALFTPEDVTRGAHEEELRKAAAKGRAEDERWHLRKDGSRFFASGFVRPVLDGAGNLRGFSKVARDVTERKEAEDRDGFLADLNRALQPLTDPDEVTAAAARLLGEHLDADRCAYAEVEPDEDHFRITGDYATGVRSIVGRFAMSAFGAEALRLMREDEPYVAYDAERDDRVSAADLAAYRQTQIRSVVCVPLHKGGRFVAGMAVHQRTPRRWSGEEVELVETVAERCWESMERARAVRSLRRSEERFRTLADNISQLAWMADENGWIFWYNKRWFDYTGTTLDDMQGWGWRKVHHPEHVDRVVERVGRAWDAGEPWEDTFPLRARDGAYRWFLSRARPIRDEAGRIVRWFGTNTDVTEQREAEEALRQSEERYRAVIEQTAEGIYLVDADTLRILEANPAFRELLGYDAPEELVGRDVHELVALPREEVDEAARLTLGAGRRLVGERNYRRKDGSLVDVEVGTSVISYGGRRAICAVVRDMTERRQAEEALRESEERLRFAVDAARLGSWDLDLVTGAARRSLRHDRIFGYEEMLPEWSLDLFLEHVHPEDRSFVRRYFEDAAETGGAWEFECRIFRSDGALHWIWARGVPYRDENGQPARYLGGVIDITERKRAEEELRRIREAERRRISRDLHDVVLQDLSGALQALQLTRLRAQRSGLDLDLSEEVEALRRAAEGLRGAVHDLRLQGEQHLVRAVGGLVESERRMDPEREVDLSVREGFPEELPERLGSELLRVVGEALTNARKHSGARRVEVALSTAEGRVQVEVTDDGRGFVPDETSETSEGGVGLSTMRERVESLGGTFEVRSRPGKGTRVTARVPFV